MLRNLSSTGLLLVAVLFCFDEALADEPEGFCQTWEIYKQSQVAKHGKVAHDCYNGPCDDPTNRDANIPGCSDPIKIVRLYFHIFCEDDGSRCATTAPILEQQVRELNSDYLPMRIQFTYDCRFVNSSWYRWQADGSESEMKEAYALNPVSQMNIYITYRREGSFGIFPWDDVLLPLSNQGGIVLALRHVYPDPFHDDALAHEVGHTLGLWHTHHGTEVDEGDECGECWERADGLNADITGDLCSETPPTPRNYHCTNPGGTDICSGIPWGWTDYHNFMSYAPLGTGEGKCWDHFDPQQKGRAHCWMDQVLSSWYVVGNDPGEPEWSRVYDYYPGSVYLATGIQPMYGGWYLIAGVDPTDFDLHTWEMDECGESYMKNHYVYADSSISVGRTQPSEAAVRSGRDEYPVLEKTDDSGFVALTNRLDGPWITKLTSWGSVSWSEPIDADHAYSVAQTSDGGFLVGAVVGPSGSDDITLIKYTSFGSADWTKTIGGDADQGHLSLDAKETSDGGYIVLCDLGAGSPWWPGWYLVKLDYFRNPAWDKMVTTALETEPVEVLEVSGGDFVVAWNSGGDISLTKIDGFGPSVLWERTYGDMNDDSVCTVSELPNGGFVIAGVTHLVGSPFQDFYLITTDPSGQELRSETFDGLEADYLHDGTLLDNYNYIMCGIAQDYFTENAFVVKTVLHCCIGTRGNVDGDPAESIDIADMVYLVDFMFSGGPAPPCMEEADINGDGGGVIDISDLAWLIDYMFTGGPLPAACP